MKSLKMGKVFSTIKRKNTLASDDSTTPEAVASRSVRSFCESGSPNSVDDEVIHLPPIVESAESSPAAAKECAYVIREYLKKDYYQKPDIQYNALMLVRILAENPGATFTQNIDQEFVKTAKDLLRVGRYPRVKQMLMETLEHFETTKFYDEGLIPLIDMWKREKEKASKAMSHNSAPIQTYLHQQTRQQQTPPPNQMPHMMTAPPIDPHSQNYFSRSLPKPGLPDPAELASRLEEARTSAKLLEQVVVNTPPSEVLSNDLMKEFAERCQSASRSVQGYMAFDNPAPDTDTMESLIDTNEHLQASLHLHQRAMLNARKLVTSVATDGNDLVSLEDMRISDNRPGNSRQPSPPSAGLGISMASGSESRDDGEQSRATNGKGKGREYEPVSYAGSSAGPSRSRTPHEEDPFRDPDEYADSGAVGGSRNRYLDTEPRLSYEPFHPGFGNKPSYSGRQESAIGKETMHGAVDDSSSTRHDHATSDLRHVDISDDDSLYDRPIPKKKEPIYRY